MRNDIAQRFVATVHEPEVTQHAFESKPYRLTMLIIEAVCSNSLSMGNAAAPERSLLPQGCCYHSHLFDVNCPCAKVPLTRSVSRRVLRIMHVQDGILPATAQRI
jgi:hypothetical protein